MSTPNSPLPLSPGLTHRTVSGAANTQKSKPLIPQIVTIRRAESGSSTSSDGSQRSTPKVARFTEATSVNSPAEIKKNPFKGPPINVSTNHVVAQPQPADIGFGFMSSNEIKHTSVEMPMTPAEARPMKSALKVPGTPGRFLDPRSPTFHQELALEKEELKTERRNAKDFKAKKRVRIAKFFLRGVNFSCALIVLSMLSTSLTIFNSTKTLASRSNLPPWAAGQQIWPQIVLLVVSSISLAICCFVFYSYWKGGHRKAQKTAVYYATFSIGIFVFSTVMWIIAAAVLHSSKANGNGQDFWGWSCNDNKRANLFQDEINYTLVCRLQNWSLICCLIEVVIETITISIYAVVLYRLFSKRKLHKSMNVRDKARSDLYLAQLRLQSAPNTPGYGMKSSTQPTFPKHLHDEDDESSDGGDIESGRGEEDWARRHQEAFSPSAGHGQQMAMSSGMAYGAHLNPPAPTTPGVMVTSATPIMSNEEWREHESGHVEAAPGEETYAAVAIPGAYSGVGSH